MNIAEVEKYLSKVKDCWHDRESSKAVLDYLSNAKTKAVATGDEPLAKRIWCLEEAIKLQDKYISAFKLLKSNKYYDAWCLLEKVEHGANRLAGRLSHADMLNFQISFIGMQTIRLQSVFPYKVFISPEYVRQRPRCGLCNAKITPKSRCQHEPGEIYGGELCVRNWDIVEVRAIALVTNPVQKLECAPHIRRPCPRFS
jgi:hypothetical protein